MKQLFVAFTFIFLCLPICMAANPTGVPWSMWSDCNVTCGSGVRTRQATCNNITKFGHETCSAQDDCPCDCYCSDTSRLCHIRWLACGLLFRNRCKKTCGRCGCSSPCAPVYGDWKEWGPCSVSCGDGIRLRYRDCTNKKCYGSYYQEEVCNQGACANNGSFGSWMHWSNCSATCGTGIQKRSRTCGSASCVEFQHQKCPAQEDCGCECSCKDDEGVNCNGFLSCWFRKSRCKKTCGVCSCSTCPAVYGDWTPWDQCRTSLCEGIQFRYRDCSSISGCDGPCKEERSCEWGPWTPNGNCSEPCGGGMVSESRTCFNPFGCTGNNTRTVPCNTGECTVCTQWSECTTTCGVGVQQRTRMCGENCFQLLDRRCNTGQDCLCDCSCRDTRTVCTGLFACFFYKAGCQKTCGVCQCPSTCPPVHGDWGDWTPCSVTCGQGERYRYRSCNRISNCIDYKESEVCNQGACPPAPPGTWSMWSVCTTTCGVGMQLRRRDSEIMRRSCNLGFCPVTSSWSACSRSCGNGTQIRKLDGVPTHYRDCNDGPCTTDVCQDPFFPRYGVRSHECCDESQIKTPCGISTPEGRIVGGVEAKNLTWPWMVGIFISDFHSCGGSLITEDFVLTAAHCFDDGATAGDLVVSVGGLLMNDPAAQTRQIANIHIHPDYVADTNFHNDIAVLKMKQPVQFGITTVPICLPQGEEIPDDVMCVVAGWGATVYGGDGSSALLEVEIRTLPFGVCQQAYPTSQESLQICAGKIGGGIDSCQGDSGGPLMCQRCSSCQWAQFGVVSSGFECARADSPGSYTRVSYYEDWINEITGSDGMCYEKSPSCT